VTIQLFTFITNYYKYLHVKNDFILQKSSPNIIQCMLEKTIMSKQYATKFKANTLLT
jgi:hypothetical protein